jgi:seryl-tRNA synthetase
MLYGMLDVTFIRDNQDIVRAALKNKNREVDLERLLVLADERKKLAGTVGDINRRRNEAQANRDIEAGKRLKDELEEAEIKMRETEKELVALLVKIPNIPSADTPIGPDESGNKVIAQWGEKPQFAFEPKAHWDIGKDLGVIDSEKAADVSGARFTYIKGDLAMLQFALQQLVFATLTSQDALSKIITEFNLTVTPKAFIPIIPPIMMRAQIMNRMARLDPIDERYYFEKDDIVLIGSAEHTLGPMHMDETLPADVLPLRYIACTPAFRREAGAAGKDTRGILRQHQFDKAEMESFSLPEDGMQEQEFLVAIQQYFMRQLKIHHQVVLICTGDMGFPDHRQFDIESWMPGQQAFRETHTSDYMGGFQARRLNTKVKRADGTEPIHMNDATAIAMGRTIIAIIENYQNEDGTITIPEVLRSYMGGKEKIEKIRL